MSYMYGKNVGSLSRSDVKSAGPALFALGDKLGSKVSSKALGLAGWGVGKLVGLSSSHCNSCGSRPRHCVSFEDSCLRDRVLEDPAKLSLLDGGGVLPAPCTAVSWSINQHRGFNSSSVGRTYLR